MKIILSPAKKMKTDDAMAPCGMPVFLDRTQEILRLLQARSPQELQSLWKCNARIAEQNVQRLQGMDLRSAYTPAVFAYDGIQYQYMAPRVLDCAALAYLQEHLRILSGFYGILRPMDAVVPYRLEMQAELAWDKAADLYDFWGESLFEALEDDCIVDLASKEYSRAVLPHAKGRARVISPVFADATPNGPRVKATFAKMARGEMVRFMAEEHITDAKDLRRFDRMRYRYEPSLSAEDAPVFLRCPDKTDEPAWEDA